MAMGKKGRVPTWKIAALVSGMLFTGTLNTLTTKIQFSQFSVGLNGKVKQFQKPWFGTFNMMGAMALVGITDLISRKCCSPTAANGAEPLIDQTPRAGGGPSYTAKVMMVALPAIFDLLATGLCCYGMLYIPASVWQMLRGSSIVFAAILSILFLKRKMLGFNWLGLFLCVCGVSLVGVANVLGTQDDPGSDQSNMVLGMGMVVLGQVVQAAQVIAEEFLMKDLNLPAMQVIGLEGYWGVLCMVAVVYPLLMVMPGTDEGHAEDPFDTWVMIRNNSHLAITVLLYLVSCGTYNATGIAVTGALSGVHRMMLDASRTMVIWAFGLSVHYFYDPNSLYGEVWTQYSPLQLVGFVVIVTGQAIYGEVLKVPGIHYPPLTPGPSMDASMFASPGAATMLCSPLPPLREG